MPSPLKSPCNKVCQLDFGSGWCLGCGRSGEEIQFWTRYTDAKRDRIMAALGDRLEAMGLPREGDPQEAERRAEAQRMRRR